jgi:3-phosphoglycerate kinase
VLLLEDLLPCRGGADDPDFANALAALGDVYVNDAFSAAPRACLDACDHWAAAELCRAADAE